MRIVLLLCFLAASCVATAQRNKDYTIAFYNVENLFDTINQPEVRDTGFTPNSDKQWNTKRYTDKLTKLSRTIANIGDGKAPTILGLCEVENKGVIEDLLRQPALKGHSYRIVHQDSPDKRGIDVALLYQPRAFKLESYETYRVLPPGKTDYYTREILRVTGWMDGQRLHFFVNHWPSRRGGAEKSAPLRQAAAATCKNIIDSITIASPNHGIVVLGDFNDDPTDASISQVLQAKPMQAKASLINPWVAIHNSGQGSLAYRGNWNLFDQILLSPHFFQPKSKLQFSQAAVHLEPELLQQTGNYVGYPNRTFAGSKYLGGYSDHLPVKVILTKY